MSKNAVLLFNTLRHLKPVQFYWRVYLKLNRLIPFSIDMGQTVNVRRFNLLPTVTKYLSLANDEFTFLNQSSSSALPIDWNAPEMSKLWLYNQHYFDYLNLGQIDKTVEMDLINDWIAQNKIGDGNGWEPYPLSLRIVNWIKFLTKLEANADLIKINQSLFLQSRFLFKHLEYHLLGNHLFKNGVALIYAGAYFEGMEAASWLKKGMQIISQQIREQVLADGGHFERSPMYHALILEDILDCLNLDRTVHCFEASESAFIKSKAIDMLCFLADIVHQDGEIPFFNDSALKIAPCPVHIFNYAETLGLELFRSDNALQTSTPILLAEKPDFGLYVLKNRWGQMIFDAGVIGPDYLPGHAHCDTLSYELSMGGHRCIVNSGTYQYAGELRNHFRATRAHNTVRIDSEEQHEIWSTFRIARRGYPFDIKVIRSETCVSISAAHSGYKRLSGQPVHRREIVCGLNEWVISDTIEGNGTHLAESFVHLHPAVEIISQSSSVINCVLFGIAFSIKALDGAAFDLEDGFYSPEFGLREPNKVLALRKRGMCPVFLSYRIALA